MLTSPKYIFRIERHVVAAQELHELLLEGPRAMMLLLPLNVGDGLFDAGHGDAERSIPLLSCELPLLGECLMNPLR